MMNPIGAMPWMMVGQVLIWLAVVIAILLIVRESARTIRARQEPPLAVVQRRLAQGEIRQDEYETVRRIFTPFAERDTLRVLTTTPHDTA